MQLDSPNGAIRVTRLGNKILDGEQPQLVVPAGVWQGARLDPTVDGVTAQGFALVGCTVSPPWDERGFTLGSRVALTREFPAAAARIAALTR